MKTLLSTLSHIVGADNLITAPLAMQPYATDWRGQFQGLPLAVALPTHKAALVALISFCATHKIAMVPQGGNTSLCGAATPDASGQMLVINLKKMNRILFLDPTGYAITLEAGVTLSQLEEVAKKNQRYFPLSLASQGSCQIGGNISTNAGGMTTLKYGCMRNLVLGLEVVLPNGQVLNQLHLFSKDTTGLDMKQLFVGAEGTLGIITAATLKLFLRPHSFATALIGFSSFEKATESFLALKKDFGDLLERCEVMGKNCIELVEKYTPHTFPLKASWLLLIELTSPNLEDLTEKLMHWLDQAGFKESLIAQSFAQQRKLWSLREAIPEAEKNAGYILKHDIALPISTIGAFLRQTEKALSKIKNAYCLVFGHLGDGSLHFNVRTPLANESKETQKIQAMVYEKVIACGGTIAAEHGIGQAKKKWLWHYKDPVALSLMHAVKKCIDPQGLMNPKTLYSESIVRSQPISRVLS